MNQIERYLTGEIEYEALTDAERNAICAAMEGRYLVYDLLYEGEDEDGNTHYSDAWQEVAGTKGIIDLTPPIKLLPGFCVV